MTGYAPQMKRVLVVYLTAQQAAAPRIHLGGRDSISQLELRSKAGLRHAEGLEYPFMQEGVEGNACHALDDLRQEDSPEVGIAVVIAGRVLELHTVDALQCTICFGGFQIQRGPTWETRRVGQQVPHEDSVFASARELGHVIHDAAVDIQGAVGHQKHCGGGQSDDLGEAGEIVNGVFVHRPRVVVSVPAHRGGVRHRSSSSHH